MKQFTVAGNTFHCCIHNLHWPGRKLIVQVVLVLFIVCFPGGQVWKEDSSASGGGIFLWLSLLDPVMSSLGLLTDVFVTALASEKLKQKFYACVQRFHWKKRLIDMLVLFFFKRKCRVELIPPLPACRNNGYYGLRYSLNLFDPFAQKISLLYRIGLISAHCSNFLQSLNSGW